MTPEEGARYLDILTGKAFPDHEGQQAGRKDHAAGRPFHRYPEPFHSIYSLSWRLGWRDAAEEARK